MDRFFQPKSVAIVGISTSQGNLARFTVNNLTKFNYEGYIYLVGSQEGVYLGHKIYASVLDIRSSVDLAVILIPASAVPRVLQECGEKGIQRVVVQSSGFRELGPDRGGLEEEIRLILKQYGIRMIGPNCIGTINHQTGLVLPFVPFEGQGQPGPIACLSHSGGIGTTIANLLEAENIGYGKLASLGNCFDVNEAEMLEYLCMDDETEIIFGYLEGIADGRRLMEIAAHSSKPIIVHKSNNGVSGALIAQSHSASLSSDDRVVDAAFKQCGIIRTREQRDAIDFLKGFSLPPMKGSRLAVFSKSGGHAVVAADAAEEFKFQLPPFPEEITRIVLEHSKARVINLHNPLDLGDMYNISLNKSLVEKTIGRDDVDGVLFIHLFNDIFEVEESRKMVVSLGEMSMTYQKPIALCAFGIKAAELSVIREAGKIPIFSDPREAIRALAANRDGNLKRAAGFSEIRPEDIDMVIVKNILDLIPTGSIDPGNLASILSAYGIAMVPMEIVNNENEVFDAAQRIGFPVVMKTAQPEVIHKNDVGGVHLAISNEDYLRSAYRKLLDFGPAMQIQKMSESGMEWLVGGRQNPQFGPVMVVGLGGINVEIYNETSLRIAPLDYEEAGRMVEECRGSSILKGIRGKPALDRQGLLDIVVRISWLLTDFPEIKELDLNPVRVFQDGCLALDWRATKS